MWLQEAIRKLQQEPGAERCGAWLETFPEENTRVEKPSVFAGEVRESGERTSTGEWTLLSLEPPLPLELLFAGKSAEFQQPANARELIVGPAMGMHRGLWVPVMAGGALRGLPVKNRDELERLLRT